MTDPDPYDDLASAHLDGATSPEEAAQMAADPALRARVEALRTVQAAVRAAVPVDPSRREAAIAAALVAFDDDVDDDGDTGTPVAPAAPLTAARARRRVSPAAQRGLRVAAVVLLVALLIPVLGQLGGRDDDEEAASDRSTPSADTNDEAADAETEAGAETFGDSAEASTAEEPSATSTRSAAPIDLGAFDELTALVAAVDSGALGPSVGAALDRDFDVGGGPCPTPSSPASGSIGSRPTATATVDGEAVVVIVATAEDGTRSLRILTAATCALLVDRPLPGPAGD